MSLFCKDWLFSRFRQFHQFIQCIHNQCSYKIQIKAMLNFLSAQQNNVSLYVLKAYMPHKYDLLGVVICQ